MKYVCWLRFVTSVLLTAWLLTGAVAAAPKPADEAFVFSASLDDEENLQFNWAIAPGYYLYRTRISAALNNKPLKLTMPRGELKDDPTFGPTEIYHREATANTVGEPLPKAGRVLVTYQGCGENTVCYPPITKAVDLTTLLVSEPNDATERVSTKDRFGDAAGTYPAASTESVSAIDDRASVSLDGDYVSTLLAFLGLGLLLSFTPCVLPMVPILSGILTRSGGARLSAGRGFAISSAYVLATATAYATLGVFAAWTGDNLQAVLQTPVAIGLMGLIFIALAMSMFGLFELRLPQSWSARLIDGVGRDRSLGTAAVLGFGSALIVGPCVTPPLAAALIYVSQTGNTLRGSSALFALGLGMGLPLLAFGTIGARALPKSGPWLLTVKYAFAFMFLALAMWMASRLLPPQATAIGWGFLFLGLGAWIGMLGLIDAQSILDLRRLAKLSVGLFVAGYGFFLLLGGAAGLQQPMRTLASIGLIAKATELDVGQDDFQVVASEAELDAELHGARIDGKTVLLDFSAEWCTECKIMERTVFKDPAVRRKMVDLRLIRADMTDFDASRKNLMQRFSVVGPPTLIFLSPDGREIEGTRSVGSVGVGELLGKMSRAQQG